MFKKQKDFFGFNKTINWNKLKDPKVLKELEKIFEEKKLTSERASLQASKRASRRDNMKVKKVNWYDEELHKFYDTKKDNDGFIYGLYGYDGDNIIDVQWFKSEIERDQQASEQKG
jgi:hypothetical protein